MYRIGEDKVKLKKMNALVKTVEYNKEIFINLRELYELISAGLKIEMQECLITPYYLQDNRRMELYQYEFCCTDKSTFEEHVLTVTGKIKIEEIPQDILSLKKKCFSTINQTNGLLDFLKFLFENKELQKEIEQIFGSYTSKNLYAIIY